MEQSIKSSKVIGDNIKRLRKEKNFTQERFICKLQLKGCDMSRGTFSKIESGTRHISISELKSICEVLKVDYNEILNSNYNEYINSGCNKLSKDKQ